MGGPADGEGGASERSGVAFRPLCRDVRAGPDAGLPRAHRDPGRLATLPLVRL